MYRFKNNVVIVTGAAHGIGRATATRFHLEGASVVLADVNEAGLADLAAELGDPDRTLVHVTDVSSEEQVRALVEGTVTRFNQLDILVNNAGTGVFGHVTELPTDDWRRILAVDVDSVFFGAKYAIPHLRATGGNIVNTASISGLAANYGLAVYCTAKGAVVNLTRNLAIDHAAEGIRVNSVCPGPVRSHPGGMMDEPAMAAEYAKVIPMGRVGEPEEIAAVITFLASTDAAYVTGHNMVVDGGVTAHTGEPNFRQLYSKARPVDG